MVKTKIICTLGPASSDMTVLRKMMLAGMDIARLNFSHATHREHQKRIDMIRELNRKYRRGIKILQDLEGYRIRIGKFKEFKTIELKKKQKVFLTNNDKIERKGAIPFDYKGSLKEIKIGSFIYVDDGNISLKVIQRFDNYLKAEVVIPGVLKENKGINIPDIDLKFENLTRKDKDDLLFGIKNKVDYVAQSFVRNKKDIKNIREFLRGSGLNCKIIAKIENREGIKNIDEILDVSDGILVARGDMGVALPIYEVPVMQKMIIRKCNRRKKIVITATQMLESMTEHLRPTRAEVSDVANAILDGTDYLMLSAETAVGKYPVEAVKMMNHISKFTERAFKKYL
ncbi:MAG: pyruvate kinase [candidate division Zixibacteria bacterium]|nr:pyruvate kinase [candidate division Zixibacteria bacterium]